jgi:hypothetical protein
MELGNRSKRLFQGQSRILPVAALQTGEEEQDGPQNPPPVRWKNVTFIHNFIVGKPDVGSAHFSLENSLLSHREHRDKRE